MATGSLMNYALRRLLVAGPVVLGTVFLGFVLLQAVPSDPASVLAGPEATPELIEAIRRDAGLDKPWPLQFLFYVGRLLQLDLGRSMLSNTPVLEELQQAFWPTLELLLVSMLWAIPLSIGLGTLAAARRGGVLDRLIMICCVAGVAVPVFWVGLMLVRYVGLELGWLPFMGRAGPVWTAKGFTSIILPAVSLGVLLVGPLARMTRASVLEVLQSDHVRTARAKGLRESSVVLRHGLRNALIPVVTIIGLQCGNLLGGAVITETIFSWPGIGRMAVGAILNADYPVAQGCILAMAISFVGINLLVDLAYVWLDPRVSHA